MKWSQSADGCLCAGWTRLREDLNIVRRECGEYEGKLHYVHRNDHSLVDRCWNV